MSLESETATKQDIGSLRAEMKCAIAAAVDPLRDEMADFRSRLQAVESRPAPAATSSFSSRHLKRLRAMDVSNFQIAVV
eukprot:8592686-Pyramimonas_sp.AAC.1